MKLRHVLALALTAFVGIANAQSNPGIIAQGAVTNGHCVKFVDRFHVLDAGAACSAGGVTTFNGRSGAVVPATNDYSAAQVSGLNSVTGAIKGNGAGTLSQAACADLSNAAVSCSTDATNATNISSGTLGTLRLPSPFTSGTISGNTSQFASVLAGAKTANHIATWDASGNIQDGGVAGSVSSVGVAAGSGAITSGTCTITTSGTCTVSLDTSFFKGLLYGLIMSNDATNPTTTLDIASGSAVDSTNALMIKLGAFTKLIKTQGVTCVATFVAGSGQCGMTVAVVASTWYHVFLIVCSGTADIYFDTSVTAANKPACATSFRRIGSVQTDASSNIISFVQNGDNFMRGVVPSPLFDYAGTNMPNNVTTTQTLASVPPGVRVEAIFLADFGDTATAGQAVSWRLWSPDTPNLYSAGGLGPIGFDSPSSFTQEVSARVWTNASAQIKSNFSVAITSTTTFWNLQMLGYNDLRGK